MIKKELLDGTYFKYITSDVMTDFVVNIVGYEKCSPDKRPMGPMIENHYVVHYVLSGKGYLYVNNRRYTVAHDEVFFIPPDVTIKYFPDKTDPWEYVWLEYNGANADVISRRAKFSRENPIWSNDDPSLPELLVDMINASDDVADDVVMTGYAMNFFGKIIRRRNPSDSIAPAPKGSQDFLHTVFHYIDDNYSRPELGLTSIAQHFHLSPCYLSRYFKRISGRKLSNYITDLRLRKACELLESRPDLSVGSIARSVGFTDPLYFSKIFRKFRFTSPTSYAKSTRKPTLDEDGEPATK